MKLVTMEEVLAYAGSLHKALQDENAKLRLELEAVRSSPYFSILDTPQDGLVVPKAIETHDSTGAGGRPRRRSLTALANEAEVAQRQSDGVVSGIGRTLSLSSATRPPRHSLGGRDAARVPAGADSRATADRLNSEYNASHNVTHTSSGARSSDPFANGQAEQRSALWPTDVDMRISAKRLQTHMLDPVEVQGTLTNKNRNTDSQHFLSRWMADISPTSGASEIRKIRRKGVPMLHPDSTVALVCELAAAPVICFDVLVSPFVVAWDLTIAGPLLIFSWLFTAFWLFDCLMKFNKAVYFDGELITGRAFIAMRYLRGGFVWDFGLVLFDIASNSLASASLESRPLRVLRVVKMARMSKVYMVAAEQTRMWNMNGAMLVIQFAGLLIAFFFMAHISACIWWLLGTYGPADTGRRWVEQVLTEEIDLVGDRNVFNEYATSLHWTIAQMTLGAMDVNARNSLERIWTIFILIIGMVVGTSVMSLMSAAIVRRSIESQATAKKMLDMRQFLRQERIPAELSSQVQRQLAERLNQTANVDEDSVPGLLSLSKSLRMQLRNAIRLPIVAKHELFRMWNTVDGKVVLNLCEKAVSFAFMQVQDDVFLAGEVAQSMFFLAQGTLSYLQNPYNSMVDQEEITVVSTRTWVSEAALWCKWIHVGDMEAVTEAKIFAVHASEMWKLVFATSPIQSITITYATNFHQRVTVAIPPHEDWPSDLSVPNTESLLSTEVELALLKAAKDNGKLKLSPHQEALLVGELDSGKCCLQVSEDEGLKRTVMLVTLRLVNGQGEMGEMEDRILVHVGKVSDGKVEAGCKLPGTKRTRGESPGKALQRLLAQDLPMFTEEEERCELISIERQVERTESSKYGIDTLYVKSVQHARTEVGKMSEVFPLTVNVGEGEEVGEDESGNPEAKEVPEDLRHIFPRPLYAVPEKDSKLNVYAWLTDEELEFLKITENTALLKEWLKAIQKKGGLVNTV